MLVAKVLIVTAALGLSATAVLGQMAPAAAASTAAAKTSANPGYLLGPNDAISVQVIELPEIPAKPYRIDSDGTVNLPFAGRVHAAGLTLDQFEAVLEKTLHAQVLNPHVSVSLVDSKSQPVSVLGAVNSPGTQQLEGSKTLFDVIAGAGGLKSDAGDTVIITRQKGEGAIDLPNAVTDPASGRTTAEVPVHDLIDMHSPRVNLAVRPHDEVFVTPGKVLYVIGNVKKPGGFTLSGKRNVSTLEALSLAEGFTPNAASRSARILRRVNESDLNRKQIPVNLKRILAGKDEDIRLQPDDILFVPNSNTNTIIARTAEVALGTVSGVIIWRGF